MVLGMQGSEMYRNRKSDMSSVQKSYEILKESFILDKAKTQARALNYYFQAGAKLTSNKLLSKEELIDLFSDLSTVIDYKEGAANTLLNNTVWMDREKDNDEEAQDALSKYADSEKLAFAQHFSSSKFLESRINDPVWIDEKKSIDRRRLFQKIPVLGRFI